MEKLWGVIISLLLITLATAFYLATQNSFRKNVITSNIQYDWIQHEHTGKWSFELSGNITNKGQARWISVLGRYTNNTGSEIEIKETIHLDYGESKIVKFLFENVITDYDRRHQQEYFGYGFHVSRSNKTS